jgi:hypothetical protein
MNRTTTSLLLRLASALALGTLACGRAWAQTPDVPPETPVEVPADAPADDPLAPPMDLSTPLPEATQMDRWNSPPDIWRTDESWLGDSWQTFSRANPANRFTAARRPDSGWEAKAGVDSGASASPIPPEPWTSGTPSGAAWAHVTAPGVDLPLSWDKASVETRLDPAQEQGKLGTTFSRSIPLGEKLSVTLQNGFSVTQTLGATTATPSPSTSASAPATSPINQVFGTNEMLRLGILPTDTTVAVGAAKSSTDEKWLRSLGAEQKLFGGPFSVSGSVNETSTGELSKSIKAGFKHAW